ncbi:PDDEXK nuclease domain-containing protein [Candidatus Babela massiliensis]|uniref:PD-DExK superfamily nuclease n=1 Tax=Candidatus Babela massiliensis TaxID=673862 RepID=V6DH14_9BACT|nr:PDDEXK nuclease domain-containing protein [Candidatus Babela massiliensis]CDK30839.1 PD-DExK superfamily nuclease [Candidatus Babela massiliensis]
MVHWGTKVIEQLANDLQSSFPGMGGFSKRNVFRMRAFYLAYQKVPQAVAQLDNLPIFNIPWGHNAILLEKIKNNKERLWYAQKTIECGWSRTTLEIKIKTDLYNREGKAITNFSKTLPTSQTDIAQQAFKDPYIFDFLTLQEEHLEQDLEQGLIDHVQKLLLEMGKGFALVGRQYHLEIDEEDYYIDLLFYHTKLKCYVVVELKARKFDPRDVGQLNFYLSACDDLLRDETDKSTIGLLLCKSKKNFTAEYALRDIKKPIGIAEYETEIIKNLPKELKSSLPTIEEIEAELEKTEIINELKSKF